MSVGKEKRRKKRGKLVIPLLNVETMGVNGVDTLDPHLFSAVKAINIYFATVKEVSWV